MLFSSQRYTRLKSEEDGEREWNQRLPHNRTHARCTALAFVLLVILNISFLTLWLRSAYFSDPSEATCIRPQLTFSSARESSAIKYERRRLFRPLENNPYTGEPRPEHDHAWSKIIEPLTSLITPSEYEKADLGAPTLRLRDGSGYVGELAVYHELHCIKRIRRWLHRGHYYPNMTAADAYLEDVHIDHCLEYWREAAMCRADSSLATFFWRDGVPTSRAYSDHECVNWDTFDSWARSRMMDMTDLEALDQTDRWKYIRTPDAKTAFRDHPEIEAHP